MEAEQLAREKPPTDIQVKHRALSDSLLVNVCSKVKFEKLNKENVDFK